MKELFILLLLLIPIPLVFAENIEMFTDQHAYYFKVKENAVIPLEIQNNYGRHISGILQYTITQEINQAVTKISSSNTQATSFTINDGVQKISLDFGSSDSPSTLIVYLNLNYDNGNKMNVNLGPIEIHFVSDETQKNNIQNRMQSTSQSNSPQSNNPNNFSNPFQQKLDELVNQSPFVQDPQQRLQNNQLAQDSSALKQQIQKQLQDEKILQQEFEKKLALNEEFQKLHQELLGLGYNVTSGILKPNSTSTGNFDINYENKERKWAKIQGNLVNGTLTDIQKHTQEKIEKLLSILRNDPIFQGYENQLGNEGFTENNLEFMNEKNMTSILLEYQNDDSKIAEIKADFVNDELIKVELEKPGIDYSFLFPFLLILPIGIACFVAYRKIKSKIKLSQKPITFQKPQTFDYIQASNQLIDDAKNNFKEKKYKIAFSQVNQAMRLYLRYDLNLNKEITNEDLLLFLKNSNYPIQEIENCFKLSSLVDFAKHEGKEEEFRKIISVAENLIKRSNIKS